MTFELVSKGSKESIDRINISQAGLEEAKTYFMGRKQLSEEKFDELFEVKEAEDYHKPPLDYKWWEEERTNLDVEKDSEYKGGHLG